MKTLCHAPSMRMPRFTLVTTSVAASLFVSLASLLVPGMALSSPVLAQEAPAQQAPVNQPTGVKPKPVYDETADAAKDIETALVAAKKKNNRVLIQWGANWCGWCTKLNSLTKSDKEIAKKLLYEYEIVKVDVGRFNKHMALAEKYGAKLQDDGLPFLTVLDADGKAIANQETGSLEVGEAHDPAKVLAFLGVHQAAPLVAEELLTSALSKASSQNKQVLVHFGAPWCSWCHKMEAWMSRPDIAVILEKHFVLVKIDVDRHTGGGEMHRSLNPLIDKPGGGGIPWFAVLSADRKVIVTSNGPKGNIGFPASEEEIGHFASMLSSSAPTLLPDEKLFLTASLEKPTKEQR